MNLFVDRSWCYLCCVIISMVHRRSDPHDDGHLSRVRQPHHRHPHLGPHVEDRQLRSWRETRTVLSRPDDLDSRHINQWVTPLEIHFLLIAKSTLTLMAGWQGGIWSTKICTVLCTLYSLLWFNGHFPGGPGLAGARMFQFWILLELRMMEVVATTGAIRHTKLQSNRIKVLLWLFQWTRKRIVFRIQCILFMVLVLEFGSFGFVYGWNWNNCFQSTSSTWSMLYCPYSIFLIPGHFSKLPISSMDLLYPLSWKKIRILWILILLKFKLRLSSDGMQKITQLYR